MEYENFDSHLDEFDSSDEHIPSDADVDSFLDFENEEPMDDPMAIDMESPLDILAGSEEDIMDAEIRRIHLDAFPFDD